MNSGRAALRLSLLIWTFLAGAPSDAAWAQVQPAAPSGVRVTAAGPAPGEVAGPRRPELLRDAPLEFSEEARPLWQAAGASALLPGAGQLLQGERRGWIYLALEAAVWTGFAVERGKGVSDRDAYRALAWEEARAGAVPRVDGDFPYYERMARWTRSGAFDADPGTPGVQPETDPATFNGDAWRLASGIFLSGGPPDPLAPGYEAALEYYRGRAYGDAFLWDWSGNMGAMERFRQLIGESDDHLRNASLILGGALLNRVASTLDVLLTRGTGAESSLRLVPSPTLRGHVAHLVLRVVLP